MLSHMRPARKPSMEIGQANRNQQVLVRRSSQRSSTHPFAKVWIMRCQGCDQEYGCNSCDAHLRQCPNCSPRAARAEPI